MKAVILAAGESSRFWPLNKRHKSLTRICGKPIIDYTIEGLQKSGINDIIIIEGPKRDIEKNIGKKSGIFYAMQKSPLGMGDAVMKAEKFIDENFLVINAERFDSYDICKKLISRKYQMALLASKTSQPWLYGMLKIVSNSIKGIVEKPKPGKEPSKIKAAGVYLLPKDFFDYHRKTKKGQYSFEAALNTMMKEIKTEMVMTSELPSLKYPWHLFDFQRAFSGRMKRNISKKAMISKNVVIEGDVIIEEGAKIFENAVIKGPSYIGKGCTIGNNALVRDSDIEDGSIIGANCEVARSIVQCDVHLHSGFVGDSVIGNGSRIGAGIITANVRTDKKEIFSKVNSEKIMTGKKSFGAVIGDNVKIGIGTRTMPGVFIGSDCVIGPSSVVLENIDSGSKYYSKFHKNVKKRYAK